MLKKLEQIKLDKVIPKLLKRPLEPPSCYIAGPPRCRFEDDDEENEENEDEDVEVDCYFISDSDISDDDKDPPDEDEQDEDPGDTEPMCYDMGPPDAPVEE